jgi:hypothetical protein
MMRALDHSSAFWWFVTAGALFGWLWLSWQIAGLLDQALIWCIKRYFKGDGRGKKA